jgi:hypothetical protein
MISRFVTDSGLNHLVMASTAVFVAIFAGVLVYLFATRKKAFTHQKELPFYDEQQENK